MIFVYQSLEQITVRDHSCTELLVNIMNYLYDLRQISSFTAFKSKLNNH